MEIKKTGMLFSFCCMAPLIVKNKNLKLIKTFENIGLYIGLLFQIADDLIDYTGKTNKAGKKTKKDHKKGKATLISLLGYKNAVKYCHEIKSKIIKKVKKCGFKYFYLDETLDYIINRNK